VEAVFTGEEILEITKGRLVSGLMPVEAGGISADTRRLKEGEWYVALEGRTYDGHDFLGDAFAGGAIGCIVEERQSYPIASKSFPVIAVDDTNLALAELAKTWHGRIESQVLLICGEQLEVKVLTRLIETIVRESGKEVSSLGVCQGIHDTCRLLLRVGAGTQLTVVGLNPASIEQIKVVGMTLVPDLLVFGTGAFENFRLISSFDEILAAKVNLARESGRRGRTVLCGRAESGLIERLSADHNIQILTWPESLSDSANANWQGTGRKFGSYFDDYLPALKAALPFLSFELSWICVTVGALIGIEPNLIDKTLQLERD
jgi:UDP-N-acetylmuramoyl-tripeptide--D-alanyl-D-alanine ligase